MAEITIVEIGQIAPMVQEVLKTYTSRLRANIATGDVVNTYGFVVIYQVFLDVWTACCETCGETSFSSPVFDCPKHKFKSEWREIASGESKDGLQAALTRMNVRAEEWLLKRG